jgi:hypothetical protein
MISVSEALDRFSIELVAAGFDLAKPDPSVAWRAFKEFAAVKVECADDAVLFQVGTYSFTGPTLFELDFARQFATAEDGEIVGLQQLHCTLYYEPAADLTTFRENLWSIACPSIGEVFARVEAMPEFQVPARSHHALRANVFQEEV